jgi:hypothetical protein
MQMKKLALGVVVALLTSVSLADSITVNADAADRQITVGGAMVWVSQVTASSGSGAPGTIVTYVIPFQLPDIAGKPITNVQLNAYIVKGYPYGAPQETYVDVYGGRVASSPEVMSNDCNSATAIGAKIAKISKGAETSNTVKSVELPASFFQDIYKNDESAAGKYVFLTLRPDVAPASASAVITWATANDPKTENRPTLVISTK